MKFVSILLFLSIYLFSVSVPSALCAEDDTLTYMTEEYRPFNYTENGNLTGVSVELLKLMWNKMGYAEQPIAIYPWARGYHYLQQNTNSVLFATSRTKERERLFKWVGPIYRVKNILIASSSNNLHINSLEDAKKLEIGTIRDDVSEQLLITSGFDQNHLQRVNSIEQNLMKLKIGRIDLVAITDKGFKDYLVSENYDAHDFNTIYVIQEVGSYYAFNINVPDTLIAEFQEAFDSLKPEHQKILDNYFE